MKTTLIVILILFLHTTNLFSQWSNDPNINLLISGSSGEQVLPKIANQSNGYTYICWFDSRNGNYAVYLQQLNSLGEKQFAAEGLLISGNPQSSSLVDYDMITDDSNNAIIAFTDTRNGSDINPFIYKISSQGNFLWGANGIALSNDAGTFQANPRLAKTSDNSIVVTWIYSSSPNKIAFQKISPGGQKLWGSDPVYLSGTGTENFTYPAIVTSDNGSVISLWSGYTGSFINPGNYRLYTQKFSAAGTAVWKDTVYNLGRVTGFFVPKIFPDGNNGALYVWQDDRNSVNLQSSYVQHYSSSGTRLFPLNGSEGSSEPGYNKFDAWASYMISGNETYLVWKQANSLQSQFAIYGQRFSPSGARLWTDNAKEFIPYGSNSFINQVCYSFDTNTVVAFNEGIFGSINNLQKSFITGKSGVMGWGSTVKNISSIISEKSKTVAAMDNQGMTKIVWSDGRNGAADIYAQNINFSGQLGNTGVFINNNYQPVKFLLSQNFPNPFNPVTVISYRIAAGSFVSLKVFDILGNNIAELINEKQSPGSYVVNFDGTNMPSGIYFYTLNAGSFKETKRMLLIK
ncbi:MAG TPA: T9SS type A sorting domain-containing protein [Ignavibacteria bacterium]|nr:T9SS type A sorting domain-containing protein [Ignavibacteria bacterium]